MDQAVTMFYDDQRLVEIRDSLVIDLLHVLSHTDLRLVVSELHLCGVCGEVDAADDVGSLVTPVRDDG